MNGSGEELQERVSLLFFRSQIILECTFWKGWAKKPKVVVVMDQTPHFRGDG
jgi:hypothetical protein